MLFVFVFYRINRNSVLVFHKHTKKKLAISPNRALKFKGSYFFGPSGKLHGLTFTSFSTTTIQELESGDSD